MNIRISCSPESETYRIKQLTQCASQPSPCSQRLLSRQHHQRPRPRPQHTSSPAPTRHSKENAGTSRFKCQDAVCLTIALFRHAPNSNASCAVKITCPRLSPTASHPQVQTRAHFVHSTARRGVTGRRSHSRGLGYGGWRDMGTMIPCRACAVIILCRLRTIREGTANFMHQ